jgi:hypothetical protein
MALGSNVQCESSWYVVKLWDGNLGWLFVDVINPAIPAGLPSEISITSLASDVFITTQVRPSLPIQTSIRVDTHLMASHVNENKNSYPNILISRAQAFKFQLNTSLECNGIVLNSKMGNNYCTAYNQSPLNRALSNRLIRSYSG